MFKYLEIAYVSVNPYKSVNLSHETIKNMNLKSFGSYIMEEWLREILNKLNDLVEEEKSFPIDEIPNELLPAINNFIIGMKCPIHDGKMYVYYSDFLLFYKSLCGIESDVGFD